MMLDSRREGEGAVERDGCDLGEIISDKFLIKQGIPSMVSDDVAQLDLKEMWRVGGNCRLHRYRDNIVDDAWQVHLLSECAPPRPSPHNVQAGRSHHGFPCATG